MFLNDDQVKDFYEINESYVKNKLINLNAFQILLKLTFIYLYFFKCFLLMFSINQVMDMKPNNLFIIKNSLYFKLFLNIFSTKSDIKNIYPIFIF